MKRYSERPHGMEPDEYHGYWVSHADAEAEIERRCMIVEKNGHDYAAKLEAEVEKWKRVAVWAVRRSASLLHESGASLPMLDWEAENEHDVAGWLFDGTDEGLLAALARAAGEEK